MLFILENITPTFHAFEIQKAEPTGIRAALSHKTEIKPQKAPQGLHFIFHLTSIQSLSESKYVICCFDRNK